MLAETCHSVMGRLADPSALTLNGFGQKPGHPQKGCGGGGGHFLGQPCCDHEKKSTHTSLRLPIQEPVEGPRTKLTTNSSEAVFLLTAGVQLGQRRKPMMLG